MDKKINEIKEHFENASKEQLEINLLRSGLGKTESISQSNMKMITEGELRKKFPSK